MYYRTVIQVEILSEEPYEYTSLTQLAYDIKDGPCSGRVEVVESNEVDEKLMVQLLLSQGSDPQFFNIDHSFSA